MQPPSCGNNSVKRRRRDADSDKDGGTPATIEVYSGLYVNEATDIKGDVSDDIAREKVIGTLLKKGLLKQKKQEIFNMGNQILQIFWSGVI